MLLKDRIEAAQLLEAFAVAMRTEVNRLVAANEALTRALEQTTKVMSASIVANEQLTLKVRL